MIIDEYKPIYLKELLSLIDNTAVDTMMCPMGVADYKSNGFESVENVARMNSDIAWHNEGVRDMASRLKAGLIGELLGEDEEDDDDQ